jgi:hypothetical protein
MLQVLGFQALPWGKVRVHTGRESGDAFLLLRNFLLRSKGGKNFNFPCKNVSILTLCTFANDSVSHNTQSLYISNR